MLRSARRFVADVPARRRLLLVRNLTNEAETSRNLQQELAAYPVLRRDRLSRTAKYESSSSRPSGHAKPRYEGANPRKKIVYKHPVSLQTDIRPSVLSMRAKELFAQGEVDQAVEIVSRAKKGQTNVITWNTLLSELMMRGKRKMAHKVFVDMKRRGFKPNNRTFFVMLQGLSAVEDFEKSSQLLPLAHSLFEEYRELLRDPSATLEKPELRHVATMMYFDILGKAGLFQKMFDVFYDMDETGVYAPDKYVYSSLLKNLRYRTETEKLGNLTIQEQNAADAKLIWRRFEKDIQKRNLEIDPYCMTAILTLLAGGRPPDHQYAFEVIRDNLGLAQPGEEAPTARLPLDQHQLQAVLELCNRIAKPRLVWYFTKQAMHRGVVLDDGLVAQCLLALNTIAAGGAGSMEESERAVELLKLFATHQGQLAPRRKPRARFSPSPSNKYGLALSICWHCKDWENACKIYELATGLRIDHLRDGSSVPSEVVAAEKGSWENINLAALTFLARTALATGIDTNTRHCLRIFALKGAAVDSYHPFYERKLAELIIKMYNEVKESASEEDTALWMPLREASSRILKQRPKLDELPTLERKNNNPSLGSPAFLDKLDRAVDFKMAVRSRHSTS